ncbi:MAG: glycosyltransferase [Fulvivirga sp.]
MIKLKVLHIIKSLGRGGAEMLLPETLALHDKGLYEFHYVYFLPWKNQMVSEIEVQGGRVTCFSAKNNLHLMQKMGLIKRYIRDHNIDLVHAHLPWAGFLARFAVNKGKYALFYTEHNKQERYHWLTALLNRYTFNRQSLVIAVSMDVKESIQNNISPSIPVRPLLNGVNTAKFSRDVKSGQRIRRENGIPADAIVVGTISVFRSQKRLKEWVNVFNSALASRPSLFGVIVGDGPLNSEIVEEISRLELEGRILLPGLQTNTVEWLSCMDIFMMTSQFEGLPIALLEAMSCECAIVSTDAGGIKEVIPGIECGGVLRNVEDYQLLSEDLLRLSSNFHEIRELGEKARKRVVKQFSLKRMVAQLENLYSEYTFN